MTQALAASPQKVNVVPPVVPTVVASKPAEISSIVIAIPTMRRWAHDGKPAPESYLKPLMTGIVASLTPEYSQHVSFMLMNVDKEPEKHIEFQEVLKLPNVVSVPRPVDDFDVSQLLLKDNSGLFVDSKGRQISGDTLNWRAGETRDVSHLLLHAMGKAPYVMMLEDDVAPTSNVIPKIYSFLDGMKKAGKEFFMADLYTPAVWYGPTSAANMERYDYECCTQAMLFNSKRIPELVAYELQNPQNPIDDNIRDFVRADKDARSVFAMIPNPFQHVGAFSSNPEKSTGTVEHRSLYFEP
jgi:hypothetical protein